MLKSLALSLAAAASVQAAEPPPTPATNTASLSAIIDASPRGDWRPLAPENTLYMDLPKGRVIIELAPDFAPLAVANIKLLTRQHYFDGVAVIRVQDNYVVQWADPTEKRSLGNASATLTPEFTRPAAGLAFDALPDGDVYAPQVGFAGGFPAGRESTSGQAWLAHCYGAVGVGRAEAADSGNGAELYAVIGHAPRHLDRNITLVGRVVQGMELLSSLPRGTETMGFYKTPAENTPITRIALAADLPAAEWVNLEAMRTDSASFAKLTAARRNRQDAWFKVPAGRVDLCNAIPPVRKAP